MLHMSPVATTTILRSSWQGPAANFPIDVARGTWLQATLHPKLQKPARAGWRNGPGAKGTILNQVASTVDNSGAKSADGER